MKKINLLISLLVGFIAFVSAQNINDVETPPTTLFDSDGTPFSSVIVTDKEPADSATLWFIYLSDLGANFEFVDLLSEDSVFIGQTFNHAGGDCNNGNANAEDSIMFRIPVDTLDKWLTDDTIRFIFDPDAEVDLFCADDNFQVRLIYPIVPVPDDATITAIADPELICAGNQDVVVNVANFGSNQIDSVDINWELNGVAQPTFSLIATLDTLGGSGSNDSLLNLGPAAFVAGTNTIKVYTSMPNGANDTINDNDTIEITLNTALPPQNVQRLNITTTSIDFDMDNIFNKVVYEYGLDGFLQGTGTVDSSSTVPFTLSGLTSGTDYDIYFRNECGGGDTSTFIGPIKFTTSFSTPYFQDFEAFAPGTNSNPWPEGWKSNGNDINNIRWEAERATGFDQNAQFSGPLWDHTFFGTGGGDFLLFANTWFQQGDSATMISPPVEIPDTATALELSFWYFNFGAGINRLEVYVDTNGVENQVSSLVGQQQSSQQDDWFQEKIFLKGYEGTSVVVKFRGFSSAVNICCDGQGDMAVDDVEIKEIPKDNAAVTELIDPSGALCPGPIDPVVQITNTGVNDLTSVDVVTNVNDTLDTLSFTFPAIATGETVDLTQSTITFATGVNYDIAFYPLNPNGNIDGDSLDDTLRLVGLTTGLSGNLTLDPGLPASATNFTSFDALSNTVSTVGVCGLATVTVATGTYTDNLQLFDVPGTSPTDRLIIDGVSPDSVRLRKGLNNVDAVVAFRATSYITIKNMTIENNNTGGEEWGVHFTDNSTHDSIINVVFDMGNPGSFDVIAVGASADITNDFAEGNNASWITVMNCSVDGGDWAFRFEGPAGGDGYDVGNKFIGNTVINADGLAFLDQQDSLEILRNDYRDPATAFSDGLLLQDPMNFRINQNYIFSHDLSVNITNANSSKLADRDAEFINNMVMSTISPLSTFSGDDAVIMTNPTRIRILHNSVYNESNNGPAFALSGFALIDSLDIRNNSFSSLDAVPFDMVGDEDINVFLKMDNNHYHAFNNSTLLEIDDTTYSNLLDYQTVQPLFNIASVEGNPLWAATDSLESIGVLLNDAGDNTANILVDINGDPRPIAGALFVDIGAVEYDPPPCSAPGGITVQVIDYDTINASWISTVPGSTVEFEYVLRGNAQGTGTLDTTSADTAFIGGLTENTEYDFYLREICRRGDTSAWVGPLAFETPCMPFTISYFEDFDAMTVGQTPDCWLGYETYSPNATVEIQGFNSFSPNNSLELDSWFQFTQATDSLLAVSPKFPAMTGANLELKFWVRGESAATQLIVCDS